MLHQLSQLCELVVLFAVCAFGPGFLVVRRLPWNPAEKVAASFVLSSLALGLAAFGIYLTDLPRSAFYGVSALCAVTIYLARSDWQELLREPESRRVIIVYSAVAGWMLGFTALVRSFGGAGWSGDWLEHFERARLFLHHLPIDTVFSLSSGMSSRPPLMNLIASHFMGATGISFSIYQLSAALLTSTFVFPIYLIAQRVSGERSVPLVVMISAIALNPALAENASYPWTKGLAAAFVVLAAVFYSTAWKTGDSARFRFAVVAASAAVLTHYSALVYVGVLAAHFSLLGFRSFARPKVEFGWMLTVPVVVLAPWIGWTVRAYGFNAAFGAIAQVQGVKSLSAQEYVAIAIRNIVNTIVPPVFRGVSLHLGEGGADWIRLHEWTFVLYQTNALLMLGSGAVLILFAARSQWTKWERQSRNFWAVLVTVGVVVGVGTVGAADEYGLAHLSLQPVLVIGVAAAAGVWASSSQTVQRLALGGMVLDTVFGIGLHAFAQARPFAEGEPVPHSSGTSINWNIKQDWKIHFLGDYVESDRWFIAAGLVIAALILIVGVARAIRPAPLTEQR